MTAQKRNLIGLTRAQLAEALVSIGLEPRSVPMRVRQVWHWLYAQGATDFARMTSLSKDLRTKLADRPPAGPA